MAKKSAPAVPTCCNPHCGKEVEGSLKCPVCLKSGTVSLFCNQKCFREGWTVHLSQHGDVAAPFNPFESYAYTGTLRPAYPLSPRREVPKHIKLPDHTKNGIPDGEVKEGRNAQPRVLSAKDVVKIRKVAKVGRAVLDAAAKHVAPGITTDELDAIVHKECIKYNAYPLPLNYYCFPKLVCTSVNEVICHGIPDQRKLEDGDIVNLDVSVYYLGFHADLNETYYVGDKAKADPETVNLVETTREALDLAIAAVKPGALFRDFGGIIEDHADKHGCSVVRTYCGHGTNDLFHTLPNIPHYRKNKTPGVAKPGIVFTIEPMLCAGSHKDTMWPDQWTAVTADGKRSAQFEHMMLVTEDGVEVLTAREADSPGGPIPRPQA